VPAADDALRPAPAPAPGADADVAADRLAWIDLEMTGLDTARHTIVEIAAIVTDSQLEILDDGLDLVVHATPDELERMDAYVRKMHTKSGLLPAIEASTLGLGEAGVRVLEYLSGHIPEPGVAPLCGNSIGVDRRFLDRYLPQVDQYLHYRSIDVSSLKELCRRWYPDEYKGRPGKAETHRALDDIRESVEELRYYRQAILKAPLPGPPDPENA